MNEGNSRKRIISHYFRVGVGVGTFRKNISIENAIRKKKKLLTVKETLCLVHTYVVYLK